MSSSRNSWLYKILSSKRTIFTPDSLRIILGGDAPTNLGVLLNRLVKKGIITNPRRGVYAKVNYNREEMACRIYTPCYISLEYVLQRAGIIFQYSSAITCVSYKSASIVIDNSEYEYRRIKGEIIIDTLGIESNGIYSIASPERAVLDTLYLNKNYAFDNIASLDRKKIFAILPIYGSKTLEQRVKALFTTNTYGHKPA